MANPDDKKAGGSTGGGKGKPDSGAPQESGGQIRPDDPSYPEYRVRFGGALVQNPQTVSGPHTLTLLTQSSRVQVALTRNPADAGIPDLSITITELPQKQ